MPVRGPQPIPPLDPPVLTPFSEAILAMSSSLLLPDLRQYAPTTLPHVLAPSNATTVPAQLTGIDGYKITTGFSAGVLGNLAPVAAPISRGVWGSLTITPPTLATITGGAALTALGTVLMDTNIYVLLYHDSTNVFAVAINTATGAAGTPTNMCAYNYATGAFIAKVTTTVFVMGAGHAAANYTFRAGTITTATLAIAAGVASLTATAVMDTPVANEPSAGVMYIAFMQNNASGLRGVYFTGTTCTIGTAVASGSIGDTSSGAFRIAVASTTAGSAIFPVAAMTAGGATSITRSMSMRTLTIAVTTGNASVGAAATAGSNNLDDNSIKGFLVNWQNNRYAVISTNASTTGAWNSFDATGWTAGAQVLRASDVPASQLNYGTWVVKPTGAQFFLYKYSANSYGLFSHLATGVYAGQMSGAGAGTTVTFGSTLAFAAAKTLMQDSDSQSVTVLYAASSGLVDQLSIPAGGVAVTSLSSLVTSGTVTAVRNGEFNDRAAKYRGTWYNQLLLAGGIPLTARTWLFPSGNNFILAGPVQ